MSVHDNKIIKTRLTATQSAFTTCITLAICVVLLFFINQGLWKVKCVNTIKNASPSSYPNITLQEAFSKFYSHPEWNYYKSSTGKDMVAFTGRCNYEGILSNVEIRYAINSDGSCYLSGGSLNGMDLNGQTLNQFVYTPFSDF